MGNRLAHSKVMILTESPNVTESAVEFEFMLSFRLVKAAANRLHY